MDTQITYQNKLLDPRWQKKRLEIFQRDGFGYCSWRRFSTKAL